MAQREQHERVKRMDRLADKLLGHKAVVMAILVVIAMASGLAMANLGGGAGGVSFERTDGTGSLMEPGSVMPRAERHPKVLRLRLLPRQRSMSMSMAPLCRPVYIASRTARGWLRRLMPPAGWRQADVTGLNRASKVTDGQKSTFQR